MKNVLSVLFAATLLLSCGNAEDKRYVSPSSGDINSIVVVIDNLLWDNNVGDAVRDLLAASVEGLSKDEPQFSMSQMPTEVFSGFAKNNRTVLKIEKGKDAATQIVADAHARPQTLVVISGQTNAEIIDQINANGVKIVNAFKTT